MKVALFNGSPHAAGNTYDALRLVSAELERAGIETEFHHVGGQAVRGCVACGGCYRRKDERCVMSDDGVNGWIQAMKSADGIVLGSPVHFSGISASFKCFLDRAFYVSGANGNLLRHKPGAGLVAVRRSGGTAALQQLNQYLLYAEMTVASSNYWNVIHGASPGEALKDEEGVQVMRVLGRNLAWLLLLTAEGRGRPGEPEREDKVRMNFIR